MKFKEFVKYQSLGNHFVVLDGFKKPRTFVQSLLQEPGWPDFVRWVADPHTGVGADSVLVLTSSAQDRMPEMVIYNADGSMAQNCSNGVRCLAHYLFTKHKFPPSFCILMAGRSVQCQVQQTNHLSQVPMYQITTSIGLASVQDECNVLLADGKQVSGTVVDVGNPHMVILQQTTPEWLAIHGGSIEHAPQFPNRTNVEFVWPVAGQSMPTYQMLVHERGVGMTRACSSGAAASLALLVQRGAVQPQEQVMINMPGGSVVGWIDTKGSVVLQAGATCVFTGQFDDEVVAAMTGI